MGLRKRAITGERELRKRVGEKRTSRWGELDSFTQIVSEIARTSVAGCLGGSFCLRRRGESGGGPARQHAVTLSYQHDGEQDKLTAAQLNLP